MARNQNITAKTGNCDHCLVPELVRQVRSGAARPSQIITQIEAPTDAIDAFEHFDQRREGWHEIVLDPASL